MWLRTSSNLDEVKQKEMISVKEKEYKDFTPEAKNGCDIFAMQSSTQMRETAMRYENQTGRIAYHLDNKEHFYTWIADNIKDPENEDYSYYENELAQVKIAESDPIRIQVCGAEGSKTKHMNLTADSKTAIIDWLNKMIP